jgi:hypothetical protein
MIHKYALSITDPWNAGETEDFESESPFMAFSIGDHVDTRNFGTRSEHRTLARVTKVVRSISNRDNDKIWDITTVEIVPDDEYESSE